MFKIPQDILGHLANRALEMVNEQIAAGRDIDGKPYEYSEKPFTRPLARSGIPKANMKGLEKSDEIGIFKTKAGKPWMVVFGGYKKLREYAGRSTTSDFLNFSGKTLSALTSKPSGADMIKLGFTNARAAEIAFYLNVSGAGRSRKLWKFMGLTKENQEILKDELIQLLQERGVLENEAIAYLKSAGLRLTRISVLS